MSDIYDEENDFKDPHLFTQQLRQRYVQLMRAVPDGMDIDEMRRCTELVLKWPGDELVQQIVTDVARLMHRHSVNPRDLLRKRGE